MNIEGLNLPPHEHREYPKVVYLGGDLKAETRTVRHALEEEEAAADGYVPAAPVPEDEALDADASSEAPEASQDPFDHDGDGKPGGSKPKRR